MPSFLFSRLVAKSLFLGERFLTALTRSSLMAQSFWPNALTVALGLGVGLVLAALGVGVVQGAWLVTATVVLLVKLDQGVSLTMWPAPVARRVTPGIQVSR